GRLKADGAVTGTFRRPRVALAWDAAGLRVGGRLQADASQGKANLRIDRASQLLVEDATLEATLDGVRSGEQALAKLSARLQFAPRPDAPLAISIKASDLRSGGMRASGLSIDADGTTAQH